MREVYIRPDGVISMSAKVRSMAGRASSIGNNVRSIVNSLDWEVSAKGTIGNAAAEIGRRTQKLAERSAHLADICRNGALEFRSADASLARSMKDSLESMRQVSKAVSVLALGSNVSMSSGGKKTEDFFSKASDWLSGAWNGAKDLAKGAADGMGSLLGGIKDFFKENKVVSNVVDGFQFILDIAGFVPGVGEIADGVNAGIYALRGDYVNAGLSAAAAIPFAGWFATGGKFVNKGIKALDKADDIYDAAKGTRIAVDAVSGTLKVVDTASGAVKAADSINGTVKTGLNGAVEGTSSFVNGERYLNVPYSKVSRGIRNTEILSDAQKAQVYKHIEELGLNADDFLISSHMSSYSDLWDKAFLGPNMFPGSTRTTRSVMETMTPRAVIAHEAGHMITTRNGTAFAPQTLYDEVLASLTGRKLPGLSNAERYQLLRDAAERARIEGQKLRNIIPELGGELNGI